MQAIAPVTAAVLLTAAALVSQDVGSAPQQPKPPALENTRWHLTATPAAAKNTEANSELLDALLFGSGTVASNVQARRGFKASSYTISPKDGKWLLTARQANAKVGEVTWNCEIAADKISGTMVFKNKKGSVESFKLNGVQAPALETTSWAIRVTDTANKSKPVEDTMLFVGHKLTAKTFRASGFLMCAYNLVPEEGGVWVLEATQRNKKDKTQVVWSGEVNGNTIKGTVTVFSADGETKSESTFEGTKTNKRVRVKRDNKRKKSSKKKSNKKKSNGK